MVSWQVSKWKTIGWECWCIVCDSFCPTDSKYVSCSDDGTVRIWDFLRCHEERILRGNYLVSKLNSALILSFAFAI